ncbi:IS630 family transposase [Limnospira platensis CENA597]|uniref:IS630 family transposase n=1 Tax=Limnospira platensis TaxID=118562 RepID=UPI003DA131AE
MPAPYSYDLRQKVIDAIELDGMPKTEASQVFHVSRNTINLWLQRKAQTGDFLPKPNRPPGHSHQITDWHKFKAFAQEHGDQTSAQMAELWDDDISPRTISRALKKIGFTRKKTYGYQERDQQQREEFIAQIEHMEPQEVVYLDEAGMNSQDSDYPYGYCEEGQRFDALKSGKRQGRVSYMAAWCHQQLLAPDRFEGCCNRTVFELWLEFILIPTLKPGQTLVLDNATFHKGGRIPELVEAAQCRLLYLPPYSPDLNKIEKCWSWLKARIRHAREQFDSLDDAMDSVLKAAS